MAAAANALATRHNSKRVKPRATVLHSKLGRRVDLHHPLASRMLELLAAARQLINGPSAYRSAQFARWHQATGTLYGEFGEVGLSPDFEDRFNQRRFGQVRDVLTDDQIYAAFKTDIQATVRDFQDIVALLEDSGAAMSQQVVWPAGWKMASFELLSKQGLIVTAIISAVFLFGLGLIIFT
jgi:hypothetical protein